MTSPGKEAARSSMMLMGAEQQNCSHSSHAISDVTLLACVLAKMSADVFLASF